MLKPNQVKRLMLHTQAILDDLKKHWYTEIDQDHVNYRQGYLQALKTVLEMDTKTINNNPINEE